MPKDRGKVRLKSEIALGVSDVLARGEPRRKLDGSLIERE
jgi:hypothetical protein